MFKFIIILPLLIAAASGSFLKLEENMEYNMSVTINTSSRINGTVRKVEVLNGNVLVQKEDNKLYAEIFNNEPSVLTPNKFEKFNHYNEPFMATINGTEILSYTIPVNWRHSNILFVRAFFMKSVMGGNFNLTTLIENGNWKNETAVLRFALGHCECEISVIESGDILKIQAETIMQRCDFMDYVPLMRDSSEALFYVTFESENMTPKEFFFKFHNKGKDCRDCAMEWKTVYQGVNEIQTRIKLQDDGETFTEDQIIDLYYSNKSSINKYYYEE